MARCWRFWLHYQDGHYSAGYYWCVHYLDGHHCLPRAATASTEASKMIVLDKLDKYLYRKETREKVNYLELKTSVKSFDVCTPRQALTY